MNYFLEDDSLYIHEPKVENSGLPQGVFLKRHKVTLPDGSPLHWSTLNAQTEIEIYGRVFRITGYDGFTSQFYESEGVALNPCETDVEDNFSRTRMMVDMKQIPPDRAETKQYLEAMLNGSAPNKNLANDRKVLSFTVLWDDGSYGGWEKQYTLNFFLSDNTIEVKELRAANSGIDPFPMLLKRMTVQKEYSSFALKKEEIYMPEDLRIGKPINIYSREFLPVNCDEFTKQWYQTHQGVTQTPMKAKQPSSSLVYH